MRSDRIYQKIILGWPSDTIAEFPLERFRHCAETGSTNDDLLALARAGDLHPFDVLSTDFQTKGRGRRGDRWEAIAGRNLLFSLALPLQGDQNRWPRLPHLTAWIVGRVVESVLAPSQKLQAKWPNDLLYEGLKLAGILVETVVSPQAYAIVGVGVNVNLRREEIPPHLQSTATSLYELLECESSRWFLLGQIILGFLRSYPEAFQDISPALDWLRKRDYFAGETIAGKSGGEDFWGKAKGIGENGALLVETETGLREIISADHIVRVS